MPINSCGAGYTPVTMAQISNAGTLNSTQKGYLGLIETRGMNEGAKRAFDTDQKIMDAATALKMWISYKAGALTQPAPNNIEEACNLLKLVVIPCKDNDLFCPEGQPPGGDQNETFRK